MTISVTAHFQQLATSTLKNIPFDTSAVSYFGLVYTTDPQLIFPNGLSTLNLSMDYNSNMLQYLTTFIVTNVNMNQAKVKVINDPYGVFQVQYLPSAKTFRVTLAKVAETIPYGVYGTVTLNVSTLHPRAVWTVGTMLVSMNQLANLGTTATPNLFEASSSSTVSSSLLAGVGAVIAVLALVIVLAVIIVRRRKQKLQIQSANEPFYAAVGSGSTAGGLPLNNPTYSWTTPGAMMPIDNLLYQQWMATNPTSSQYIDAAAFGGLEPGVANPMYGWYRPDLGRSEVEEMLVDQPDGAFIIRDSAATPGWHMLAVKTHSAIVHEKIKMNDDGMYELLPTNNGSQPKFDSIPSLVEHYSSQREGMRYMLCLENPLYDNNALKAARAGTAAKYQQDEYAPALPLKEKERTAMATIVAASGDEFYTNAEQAKAVISTTA